MKTSAKKRRQRITFFAPIREKMRPPCPNCWEPGAHYCPPSLGEPGFFACTTKKP